MTDAVALQLIDFFSPTLDDVRSGMRDLRGEVGDIRDRLIRVEEVARSTEAQAKKTNGRVDAHDTAIRELLFNQALVKGIETEREKLRKVETLKVPTVTAPAPSPNALDQILDYKKWTPREVLFAAAICLVLYGGVGREFVGWLISKIVGAK